jgi:hypothetical protein
MGVIESILKPKPKYVTDDIPRETYDLPDGQGWAYYSSCKKGRCCDCGKVTQMWLVSIKINGRWMCNECKAKNNFAAK